ncbi:hypothetical protein OBBRIDRAFT_810275 [Obba rivulosa]|uniref:DUF7721 domain-containing protein n=1 Tax=Obba rivulosa TaxID=1052685 RepID=A0A8E2DRR4_9APHY|nr:hypothetical protein OBBRIDRAFT_810275 [Obba rivulosa]
MENFMNLAKQGFEAYERSQSDVSTTGGQEYNSPHHSGQGGQPQGYDRPQFNHDEVVNMASQHGSGDSGLFSSALNHATQNQHEHNQPIDEQHVQDAHRVAYQEGAASNLSASSMGGAAAMQIMKKFTSGGGGGGGSQSELISLAMAEASKLFESAGGAASGNKQDAVNGAAMTVMKLLVQSKFSGAIGGGNSGGMGGLMGLASKFM